MSDEVSKTAHLKDDLDFDRHAHHHTLGFGPNQAAPGSDFIPNWQVPAYAANWGALGAPWQIPRYCLLNNGAFLFIEGLYLRSSSASGANSTIFQLPDGYKPKAYHTFAADSNGAHVQVGITSGGLVYVFQSIVAGAAVSIDTMIAI